MTCYIYLHPDNPNLAQEERAIATYLKAHQLQSEQIISDKQSTKLHWTSRPLHTLFKRSTPNDHIVVYEASQMACSTSQILEILSAAVTKKVNLHFVKHNAQVMSHAEQINTKLLLGIISKIESDFVSKRTAQALARRKAAGLPLGRPKGRCNKSLKLDKFRDEISKYLALGISKASIAKLVDCHPQTLYDWLDRTENNSILH